MARLKLKWAYGFADDVTAFAAPTVLNGTLFVGSAGGVVQALDAKTGCLHWTFQANGPVRTAFWPWPMDRTIRFCLAIRSAGSIRWTQKRAGALEAPRGRARGHAADGHSRRARWSGLCARGFLGRNALDRSKLRVLHVSRQCHCASREGWISGLEDLHGRSAEENRHQQRRHAAIRTFRRGVWSSPTIDAKRGVMYVTTGDNYSFPDSPTSDAVMALNLKTGKIRVDPADLLRKTCSRPPAGTAARIARPKKVPITISVLPRCCCMLAGGKDVVVAGQKSGMVYGSRS